MQWAGLENRRQAACPLNVKFLRFVKSADLMSLEIPDTHSPRGGMLAHRGCARFQPTPRGRLPRNQVVGWESRVATSRRAVHRYFR